MTANSHFIWGLVRGPDVATGPVVRRGKLRRCGNLADDAADGLNYCGEDARSEASRRAVSTVNKACRKLDKEKKTVGDCIPARVELQNWNWLTKYGTKTMGMCTENGQPSFCVAKHPDGQSLLRWEVAWNDGSYECTGMVKYGKQKKSSDGNGASEGSSSAVDVGSSNSVAFPYDYSGYPYLR